MHSARRLGLVLARGGPWYLSPPPIDRLLATLARLEAARALVNEDVPESAGPQSPREAMRGFPLSFRFSPDNSDPSALALRGRQEITCAHDGQVLAGFLKRVIDRAEYVNWQEIPDVPPSRMPYVHFQHSDVVIAPVETAEDVSWQFTPETLCHGPPSMQRWSQGHPTPHSSPKSGRSLTSSSAAATPVSVPSSVIAATSSTSRRSAG